MANAETPASSGLSETLIATTSELGMIAQTILTIEGMGAIGDVIPFTEQLLATAIKAWTDAHGVAPTVAQFQALLGDVPLVPPTA
jgi:hypothetical protein